jgi:glycosyltransferase involved in cell wall biosynthesis
MGIKKLAIFVPKYNQYSETFIKAHTDFFKDDSIIFHEGLIPKYCDNKVILSDSVWNKVKRVLRKKFNGISEDQLLTKKIKRIIQRQNVKAILFEFGVSAAENISLIKSVQIPTYVHFHGADAFDNTILQKYKNQYLEIFDHSRYIFAVSYEMVENLEKLGARREKIIYNPYGPNKKFLSVVPNRGNSFLSVGRFVDKKAPFISILAFNEVVKAGMDCNLIMVGDGELLNSAKLLAKSLDLEDKIQFKGISDHMTVFKYFAEAFCFIQHSVTDINGSKEGTPVAVLEASAASLPVISTFHSGIKEAVVDNKTGLLTEECNIYGMANHMKKLLLNRDMAKEMGINGRIHVVNNYSIEQHLNVLREKIFDFIEND